MIPIKDTIRSRSFPAVNWLIIIVNAVVFFFMLSMPTAQLNQFITTWGLVPANINPANPLTFLPFLTHMFIHGGWLHIISNLWVLFIFGDNVEDRLGSGRYLIFYLLGGIAAGTLQVVMSPGSTAPAIGASGAIAAVLGAYFLFYPRARVLTLIIIVIIPFFVNIPAIFFLGFWFISQLFQGVLSLSSTAASGGIAWWAHVGGFIFGLILAKPFSIGQRPPNWHPDHYWPY
jgi:membrane associated rhomboid family serine protease